MYMKMISINLESRNNRILQFEYSYVSVCVCVCVCVCVHVYVVYEDTKLYNDMGMT